MFHNNLSKQKVAEKLEPLFYACSPVTIKYSKAPLCTDNKYEEITVQEFEEQHGCKWTDSLVASSKIRDKIWQDNKKHPKVADSHIEERLHNPLNTLVICEIDSTVGKGVFLATEAASLPAGTVIGIYAGELVNQSFVAVDNEYSMLLQEDEHKNSVVYEEMLASSVSGKKYRNITAFIQDAPDDYTLDSVEIKSDVSYAKENIATANVFVNATTYKGCPVSYMITARVIKPGEQLFFPYEGCHWNDVQRKKRCVFNKKGAVVGQFVSSSIIQMNADYKPTKEMCASRLELALAAQALSFLKKPKVNTFEASKRFIADVISTLEIHEKRYQLDTPEGAYIKRLQEKFNAGSNIDKRFNNIHQVLSDKDYQELLGKLGTLKKELIFHMRLYQNTQPKPQSTTKIAVAAQPGSQVEQRSMGYRR